MAAGRLARGQAGGRVHSRSPAAGRPCATAVTCWSAWPARGREQWPSRPMLRAGVGGPGRSADPGRGLGPPGPGRWPERIRAAVAFAMGMLTELEENGADLGGPPRVRLDDRGTATVGVPLGVTSGPAGLIEASARSLTPWHGRDGGGRRPGPPAGTRPEPPGRRARSGEQRRCRSARGRQAVDAAARMQGSGRAWLGGGCGIPLTSARVLGGRPTRGGGRPPAQPSLRDCPDRRIGPGRPAR